MAADSTILVGESSVTLKRKGISRLVVANILGQEQKNGTEWIYLDRLIHRPGEDALGEYNVTGAISTILQKVIA